METPRFQKVVEHFVCDHCGAEIEGNGYTNHCPLCLWSKHVDVNPGDRAAGCGGYMRPTSVENENGDYVLTHTCESCGHRKRNKVVATDDFDAVVRLATELAGAEATGSVTRAPLGAGQQSSQMLAPVRVHSQTYS